MNHVKSKIYYQLISLKQKQFTGKIVIQFNKTTWYIWLRLGRLVWTDGGIHPNRSWKRAMDKYCPLVDWNEIRLENSDICVCINYSVLLFLLRKQLITREKASELITDKATETIFDIFQTETKETLKIGLQTKSDSYFLVSSSAKSISLLNVEDALIVARQNWLSWQQTGLEDWSPNLAPIMRDGNMLRAQVSRIIYQNFLRLLDGESTLRDLSYRMDKEIGKLTSSLLPYVTQELFELVEVKDIEPPQYHLQLLNILKKQAARNAPLIACIDDSPQICKIMEQIIIKHGYRFVGIQESLQALPKLLEVNPELIFLDIGMPVVNGYEICAQIRRVSKLRNIPIVFLTGNDGIVDRMRAKVAGASAFVAKPIDIEKILGAIKSHLNDSSLDNKVSSATSDLTTK